MRLPVRADRGDTAQALPREVLEFGVREHAHARLTGVQVAAFRDLPSGPADRRECLYCGAVTTQVIVLNGGSSSGKSGIARCLQAVLPDPWLAVGDDMLIQAMPASMQASDAGIEFAADGRVSVGPGFRRLEAAWMDGVAAMARAGARVIVDAIFLGGASVPAAVAEGSCRHWTYCGSPSGATARSPQAASSPVGIESAGWPCRKREWSTRAWSTTWRWTLRIASPWHVRGLSLPVPGDRRLGHPSVLSRGCGRRSGGCA